MKRESVKRVKNNKLNRVNYYQLTWTGNKPSTRITVIAKEEDEEVALTGEEEGVNDPVTIETVHTRKGVIKREIILAFSIINVISSTLCIRLY